MGGNLVAIQSSRISTSLHKASRPGKLPSFAIHGCPNCPSAFFGKSKFVGFCLPGFSLAYKNGHFDPFLHAMTPKTVQEGDNDVPQNSHIFQFPEVNVPQNVKSVGNMSHKSCH